MMLFRRGFTQVMIFHNVISGSSLGQGPGSDFSPSVYRVQGESTGLCGICRAKYWVPCKFAIVYKPILGLCDDGSSGYKN